MVSLEEAPLLKVKIAKASVSLPKNGLSSTPLPQPFSLQKVQAQNLSGNVAARVLGRSPAGSICQARSIPAVHTGVKTCVLMESAELRGHMQNRASVQTGAKGSHWVTHRVFTLLSQPTPAQAQRNSQDDLF